MSRAQTDRTKVRVEQICDMMRTLTFQTGKTAKLLAAQWGLSESRVRKLTAAASKIVLAEITDPEKVKPELCQILMSSVRAAHADKQYANVSKLAAVYSEIVGLKFAQPMTQVNVTVEGQPTPADARRVLAQEFGAGAPLPPPSSDTEGEKPK